jgi:predicted phosphodiesterase/biotin operon repressor
MVSVENEVFDLKEQGLLRQEIADKLKIPFWKVKRIIAEKKVVVDRDKEDQEKIVSWLKKESLSIGEISRRLDRSKESVAQLAENLKRSGFDVQFDPSKREFALERHDKTIFKPLELDTLFKKKIKIGIVADTQFGSKYQQPSILYTAYAHFEREKIDFALHAGDMVDGNNVYRGQTSEIFLHDSDEQLDYVVDKYPRSDTFRTYCISGNHDGVFKKDVGYNIVKHICEKRPDLVFRGDYQAEFQVKDLRIVMIHPDGGGSYAKSYKSQKILEGVVSSAIQTFSSEVGKALPQLMIFGHWHFTCHLPFSYNCCTISTPCLQAQTPYLARKGLTPEIGYIIIELTMNDDKQIIEISPRFFNMSPYVKIRDY